MRAWRAAECASCAAVLPLSRPASPGLRSFRCCGTKQYSCHCVLTLALPRSVKRLMRLWWRMLANTGSTVVMRRLYSARPWGESMALRTPWPGSLSSTSARPNRLTVRPLPVAGFLRQRCLSAQLWLSRSHALNCCTLVPAVWLRNLASRKCRRSPHSIVILPNHRAPSRISSRLALEYGGTSGLAGGEPI
jgi:hypothetical protein